MLKLIVTAAFTFGAIGLLIMIFISRTILRGIYDVKRVAIKAAEGDLSEKVVVRTKDETGLLAESFNQMTDNLAVTRFELEQKIADQERTEKALQESERRYRLLAENATDNIVTLDMELRFT